MLDKMSKRIQKIIVVYILILLSASILTSWIIQTQNSIILTDTLGRTIEFNKPPSRVVTLSPSITEIMSELGVLDAIIGVDTYSYNDWYLNISRILINQNVSVVGGYWWSTIKVEEILKLNPDVVLADKGAHRPLLETLESYGLKTIYLHGGSATSINDVYNDIYTIGLLFNRTERALELINEISEVLESSRTLLEPYREKRVLVVIDLWQGIWVAGRGTYIDDLLSKLGLINAADLYGWGSVNIETVYRWNPDLIIIACSYPEDTIRSAGLYDLEKPVVQLNETEIDILSRPGPMLKLAPRVVFNTLIKALGNQTNTTQQPVQQFTREKKTDIDIVLTTGLVIVAVALIILGILVAGKKKTS